MIAEDGVITQVSSDLGSSLEYKVFVNSTNRYFQVWQGDSLLYDTKNPPSGKSSFTFTNITMVTIHHSGWPTNSIDEDFSIKPNGSILDTSVLFPQLFPHISDPGRKSHDYDRMLWACGIPVDFFRIYNNKNSKPNITMKLFLTSHDITRSAHTKLSKNDVDNLKLTRQIGTTGLKNDWFLRLLDTKVFSEFDNQEKFWQPNLSLGVGFRNRNGQSNKYREYNVQWVSLNSPTQAMLGSMYADDVNTKKLSRPDQQNRIDKSLKLNMGFWLADSRRTIGRDKNPEIGHFYPDYFLKQLFNNKADRLLSRPSLLKISNTYEGLDLLEFLELKAKAPVTNSEPEFGDFNSLQSIPYNYLWTSFRNMNVEMQRWFALQDSEDTSITTPARLIMIKGAPYANADQSITFYLEGLTARHIAHIYSTKMTKVIRGKSEGLSLLPDIIGVAPNSVDELFGGEWGVRISCISSWENDHFTARSRYHLYGYPVDPLDSIEIYKMSDRPASQHGSYLKVFESAKYRSNKTSAISISGIKIPALMQQNNISSNALTFEALAGSELLFAESDISPATPVKSLKFTVNESGKWALKTGHKIDLKMKNLTGRDLVSLGALDLNFGTQDHTHIVINFPQDDPSRYEVIGEQGIAFPIKKVVVGGVDGERSEIENAPIILNLGDSDNAFMGRGVLKCNDRTLGKRRQISFELRPDSGEVALEEEEEFEITVIDPEPFFVVKLGARRLGKANNTHWSSATFQSDEGFWRLSRIEENDNPVMTITLPPQGIAESWERAENNTTHLGQDQIALNKRVPARLTQTSVFKIEADERLRNPIAPWNFHQIVGFNDDDLPGARLINIERFEVLYGLEAKKHDILGFRVAEIEGWRGRPRPSIFPSSTSAGSDLKDSRHNLWSASLSAWSSRLAVLDVRDEADYTARPQLENTQFKIRTVEEGAHYAQPIKNWPLAENIWKTGAEGGILGGAMAGFEQPSLIKAIYGRSDGIGELDGLQFSALGAWTKPRAEFQNGLSLISSNVEMGRVHEARFERKGRIAGLHHIAKHVIVYERRFLPGDQFYKEQDEHKGRPIVRKTREFIEISVPLRNYPDKIESTDMDAGPVIGAEFKTLTIPVNGSWASPLKDPRVRGYAIPLWSPTADSNVYPRPDVRILFAGDEKRGETITSRRIENPQVLRFYSLTQLISKKTAQDPPGNIEDWPLVYGQDYALRATDDPTRVKLNKKDFVSPNKPQEKLSSAPRIWPGMEDFTVLLEVGSGININYARSVNPMITDLRSLVLMRKTASIGPISTNSDSDTPDTVNQEKWVQANTLAKFGENLTKHAEVLRQDNNLSKEKLTAFVENRKKELDTLKDYFENSHKDAEVFFNKACRWAQEPRNRLIRLKGDISQYETQLLHALKTDKSKVIKLLDQLKTDLKPLDKSKNYIDQIVKKLQKSAADLTEDVRTEFEDKIEVARNEISDFKVEIKSKLDDTILKRLQHYINQACLLYTSPSPRDATLSRMPSSA